MQLSDLTKPKLKKLASCLLNDFGHLAFASYKDLNEELGFGKKRGDNLFLTADERKQLTKLFENQIGDLIGFLSIDSETDRITTQGVVRDEKSSNHVVTVNDIRMWTFNSIMHINNNVYHLPQDGHLTYQYTPNLTVEHSQVIVCENLAAFIGLSKYKHLLPESVHDALFIYRGNGTQVSGVYKLCANMKALVGVMSDLDLAGIVIACTMPNASFALYPNMKDLPLLAKTKQPLLWVKQFNLHDCAEKQAKLNNLDVYFEYLEENCIGVTQEANFAKDVSLSRRNFTVKNSEK